MTQRFCAYFPTKAHRSEKPFIDVFSRQKIQPMTDEHLMIKIVLIRILTTKSLVQSKKKLAVTRHH